MALLFFFKIKIAVKKRLVLGQNRLHIDCEILHALDRRHHVGIGAANHVLKAA